VIAIVQFASAQGVQVTAQRTGHHAEPLAANDDVILVKTDALQGVEIDVERVARVRSGAKWGNVVPRASELGLAALHWSTPDVSVAGYSLGLGIGWYARKLGLSSNSVTAIELVTPDRGFRRVDHQHEPDCSRRSAAAAATSASVTALEIQLYSIPGIYSGVLFFPCERSSELLRGSAEPTTT
jgi:FAD/FMN-containing dehydrogenase